MSSRGDIENDPWNRSGDSCKPESLGRRYGAFFAGTDFKKVQADSSGRDPMTNARLACTLLPLALCTPALAAPPETMIAPPSFHTAVEVNVVNVDVRITDAG